MDIGMKYRYCTGKLVAKIFCTGIVRVRFCVVHSTILVLVTGTGFFI